MPVATARTTRTRLHAVAMTAAFAAAGVFGAPAAAMASSPASGSPAPGTTAPAATARATTAQAMFGQPMTAQATTAQAGTPQAAAAPAQAPAPKAPGEAELHPAGISAPQQRATPTAEQMANAKAIVDAGKAMGLPPRAWTIAVATSLQETNLHNLGDLGESNDHDSQGLFQQRPSSGWGTVEQITDPTYAATAFYKGLVDVSGWQNMPLTNAAQKVQVSAYPDHYAKHESQAGDIIRGLAGEGPYAGIG